MEKVLSERELQEMFDKAMADIGKEIELEYEQERRQRQEREREMHQIRLLFIREMLEHTGRPRKAATSDGRLTALSEPTKTPA